MKNVDENSFINPKVCIMFDTIQIDTMHRFCSNSAILFIEKNG